MVRKRIIILTGIIVVCAVTILAEKSLSESANNLAQPEWKYGVYRVGISTYRYEWQDADGRIRARNQTEFLEKMGLVSILNELEVMADGRLRTFEYVLDVEFLNHWIPIFLVQH